METVNNANVPEQIVASNVTAIAAGYSHSLFLKRDGSLWAMGNKVMVSWAMARLIAETITPTGPN